jgi:thioredoxin-related protein
MMTRRAFATTGLAAGLALITRPSQAQDTNIEAILGDDGLYHQPWFLNSFLDLKDDLAEAAAEGKRFALIWEQRGCPYCRETHVVNFARPEINKFVRENGNILQRDIWGSREVTDFDGEALEERALARKWGIVFTPTIMFFDDSVEKAAGRSGAQVEVVRMPGYFKPFHFITMFEYVKEGAYKTTYFQRYLQDKGDRLRAQGVEVELW